MESAATARADETRKSGQECPDSLFRLRRGTGGRLLGFREVADVREVFEIGVLGPEGGVLVAGGGVDEGVGHGELVADSEDGGEGGDLGGDRDDGVLLEKREKISGCGFSGDAGGVAGDFVKADGGNNDRGRG